MKSVTKEMVANEKLRKAIRSNDIPIKIIKDFEDLFGTFILQQL